MKKTALILVIIVVFLVIFGGAFFYWEKGQTKNLDGFAQCLKDKGASFYGAFWCPHCQRQKALFGSAAKLLPYVECSAPDGNSQLLVCQEKQISGYPTWVFANGSSQSGEVTLETLAQKTGCVLP